MTDDQLLFAATLADPAEDTPRLVLADWFDEHDEPGLAVALREEPRLVAFLADLTRWEVVPHWNAFGDRIPEPRAVDTPRFSLAGCRLLTRFRSLFPVPPAAPTEFQPNAPPARKLHDPLDPGTFLSRWLHERQRQIGQLREEAARAADGWSETSPAFATKAMTAEAFEWRCNCLQELVLRGRDVTAIAGAVEHAAAMRERNHPLAWLPLSLLPVESELHNYLPHFGQRGGMSWTGPGNESGPLPGPPEPPADAPAVVATETPTADSPAFAAVRGWAEDSNGRLEAFVYRLDRPLVPNRVGAGWFARLSADSIDGPTAEWAVNRRTPAEAFAQLFAAAHTGGAYGGRLWGAYGRLHAWHSLAWLVDCDDAVPATELGDEAARCEWFTYGGTSWFDNIIDLALICVRPDRLSVALLAATDVD